MSSVGSPKELDREETLYREQILHQSMSKRRANNVKAKLDPDTPFYSRVEFIESIAAVCVLHKVEVKRKASSVNKPVYRVLWSACAPERCGWYFNNHIMRRTIDESRLSLLPSGSASNESLHAELKSIFRTIQTMHQPTLALKLLVLTFGKQMAHHCALASPTTRQMDSRTVLARSAMNQLWTGSSWSEFCMDQKNHATARSTKADLPSRDACAKLRAAVADAKKKKNAKRTHLQRKRTPFTLKREGSLVQAGAKRASYQQVRKKPAMCKKPAMRNRFAMSKKPAMSKR